MSSLGVGESKKIMAPIVRFFVVDLLLRVPFADHTLNEAKINASKLDWTIVRPGGLRDESSALNLRHGTRNEAIKGNLRVSRLDVAKFLLEQVTVNQFSKKSVWLIV